MASMSAHEIRGHDAETYTNDTLDEHGRLLATVEPATREEADLVISSGADSDDGRSTWMWVRLPNGDLILGCFPQGDTYELVTQTMIRGRV